MAKRRTHYDEAVKYDDNKRPFSFFDLAGQPEPQRWGPVYNVDGFGVEKWRKLEKKRELMTDEVHEYGRTVGAVVRKIQRRELCGAAIEVNLRCTAVGLPGTQADEDARYAEWIGKLLEIRIARQALINVGRIPAPLPAMEKPARRQAGRKRAA